MNCQKVADAIIIIIMYIYNALIYVLSAHMIYMNLNTIFYTRVKHSAINAIYTKHYLRQNFFL